MTHLHRRFFLLAFGIGLIGAARASTYGRVLKAGKPKLIKGNPDKVDFGHGLLVPMNHEAFETLWEGDDRWMTYGHGFGATEAAAMGKAEEAAVATMKLYLLTLAFAPEKLQRIDGGGWRLGSRNPNDLILGDIDLPGRPVMPSVDHVNAYDTSDSGDTLREPNTSHATTGWVVWKSDVPLDAVRDRAKLVAP